MKEKKIAWLVTHDAYIDRRILFFADVLMENGYSVKLFPSAYTDSVSYTHLTLPTKA